MTVLTPTVEDIVRKLVAIAGGDPLLVQEALSESSGQAGQVPKLEDVVHYILRHRKLDPPAQEV